MKELAIADARNVIGAAILAAILVWAGCQKKDPPAAFQRPPAPVSVAEAVVRDVPFYLDEVGKCVAREVVSIQPQVSGRITAIHVTDGADVKTGDLLFTIDPRPYQAQLDLAKANVAQAKAALELAKIQFARVADLIGTKAIAQQDYDTRKNAVAVGEAQVQQNEAAEETAELNLEYTSIHSPIDGRAGHRLVDLGNVVTANSGSLLTLERLDPIYADFTVTENDLSEVQRYLAKGALKVEARASDAEAPAIGELTFLDNAVQDATGTVMLRATIPNGNHALWPGRFVKVRLILNMVPRAVLVPVTATQMSAAGSFVYVVKDDSTAEMRPVKPGQRQGEMIVIEHGLKGGEKVIVSGQIAVAPGGKVRVEQPAAVPNAPPASAAGKS